MRLKLVLPRAADQPRKHEEQHVASALVRLSMAGGGRFTRRTEILGHASIVTTQRYGRLDEAHVQAEAERILGRFGTKRGTAVLP